MNRGARALIAVIVVAGLSAAWVLPGAAATTSALVANGSFEKPKVSGQQSFPAGHAMGKCDHGTSHHCWLQTAGIVDVVGKTVWQPKKGKQSVDLNSGANAAEFAQAVNVVPGATYQVTFWLAATPGSPDNVALAVFWGNIDEHGDTISTHEHDYSFAPFGHTASSMGWVKETFVETADPGDAEARIYFLSTTNLGVGHEDFGPVVDAVTMKQL